MKGLDNEVFIVSIGDNVLDCIKTLYWLVTITCNSAIIPPIDGLSVLSQANITYKSSTRLVDKTHDQCRIPSFNRDSTSFEVVCVTGSHITNLTFPVNSCSIKTVRSCKRFQ